MKGSVRRRGEVAGNSPGGWDAMLQAGFALSIVGGLVLVAAPDLAALDPLNGGVRRAFFGAAAPPAGSEALRRWLYAVEGSTLAAFGILGLAVARTAFRARRRWARNALALALAVWFPLDTAASLAHGVRENAVLNGLILGVLLLPVLATWRRFRGDPEGPAPPGRFGGAVRRGPGPALLALALLGLAPALGTTRLSVRGQAPGDGFAVTERASPAATGPSTEAAGSPEGSGLTGFWSFRWSRIYEDGCRLAGAGLGLRLDRRTSLALAGYGTASPSRYGRTDFRIAYLGARLDRELWRRDRWSLSGAVLVGGGSFWLETDGPAGEERTGVAVVEPELLAGADLGRLRLAAGVGYRRVSGVEDIPNRSDQDASGYAAVLQLEIR